MDNELKRIIINYKAILKEKRSQLVIAYNETNDRNERNRIKEEVIKLDDEFVRARDALRNNDIEEINAIIEENNLNNDDLLDESNGEELSNEAETKNKSILKTVGTTLGLVGLGVGAGVGINAGINKISEVAQSQHIEEQDESVQKDENELKSIDEIAKEVIKGRWGNGSERKERLTAAGYDYDKVQERVNELKISTVNNIKSVDEVANEVVLGLWGNGPQREEALTKAGYNYEEVRIKVNEIVAKNEQENQKLTAFANDIVAGKYGNYVQARTAFTNAGYDFDKINTIVIDILNMTKDDTMYEKLNYSFNESIANEVIDGKWGNGQDREKAIKAAGYDFDAIREIVNQKVNNPTLKK